MSIAGEKTGFDAALHVGVMFNTENTDTDYESGDLFHAEESVQQLLPVGPGFASIGAEAFYLDQITGDSGAGARGVVAWSPACEPARPGRALGMARMAGREDRA